MRILAEIDGGHEPDRHGHEHGDGRNHQRAREQRQQAILPRIARAGGGEARRPDSAEEEIQRIDKGEEAQGLADQ
ncbi:hypothetical protein D3C73_1504460 [compost metagenome]